jgi:two-component system CheB/CheR fusion protein
VSRTGRRQGQLEHLRFKLIPGDAGRPLSDIVTELVCPEFQHDLRHVLRTLVLRKHRLRRMTAAGSGYASCLHTADSVIDGVVITFTDITISKVLEVEFARR